MLAYGSSAVYREIYGTDVERTITISSNSSSLVVVESINQYYPPSLSRTDSDETPEQLAERHRLQK